MKIETVRFGTIEVKEEERILFKRGMLGLEEFTEYVLFSAEKDTPFYYLQSTQEPSLCFLLVDTFSLFPSYEIDIPGKVQEELDLQGTEDVVVLTTVSVKGSLKEATTNLKAPIILNNRTRVARQFVLEQGEYEIKQPLFTKQTQKVKG